MVLQVKTLAAKPDNPRLISRSLELTRTSCPLASTGAPWHPLSPKHLLGDGVGRMAQDGERKETENLQGGGGWFEGLVIVFVAGALTNTYTKS